MSQQAGASQHRLSLQEVTLELMLLGSCADPKPKEQAMVGQRASGKGPAAAALDCELLCHVAMATQLPPVGRHVSALKPCLPSLAWAKDTKFVLAKQDLADVITQLCDIVAPQFAVACKPNCCLGIYTVTHVLGLLVCCPAQSTVPCRDTPAIDLAQSSFVFCLIWPQ